MKCLEEYTLHFDPAKSNNEMIKKVFNCRPASILWCSIKSGHVTSQYFNEDVLRAGERIQKEGCANYDDFLSMCAQLTHQFGKVTVSESCLGLPDQRIDNEFWGSIYQATCGKRLFKLIIKEPQ